MKKFITKYLSEKQIKITSTILIVVAVGIVGYLLTSLSINVSGLKNDLASTTEVFSQRLAALENDLATTTQKSNLLSQQLSDQQNRNASLEQTLGGISSTVNTLEKLSKTDRELLQKYSKVYFLNENYVPTLLSPIDSKYLQDKTRSFQFHGLVLPYLTRMLDDAATSGETIQIASAYRSFGTQSALKSTYTVSYGSGANKFSADQGYSEHQLGTAVDLSTPGQESLTIKFDTTSAFAWLTNNAYRYGFILSYPKNNTYYQYEPWHWRFVGVQLATSLRNQGKYFYDLDQRQIDTYLSTIFD